jgi:pyridoxine 4-dehydrogenase
MSCEVPEGAARMRIDTGSSAVAPELGATPAQVAVAWLLRRSTAILPIPGTSSTRHPEENVAAASVTPSDAQFASLSI